MYNKTLTISWVIFCVIYIRSRDERQNMWKKMSPQIREYLLDLDRMKDGEEATSTLFITLGSSQLFTRN